jgi:hypothetical protein
MDEGCRARELEVYAGGGGVRSLVQSPRGFISPVVEDMLVTLTPSRLHAFTLSSLSM